MRGVSSKATSKGATKETRDRAERGSVVSGSARATVVADDDTPRLSRAEMQKKRMLAAPPMRKS
jgi:hypothetical protein